MCTICKYREIGEKLSDFKYLCEYNLNNIIQIEEFQ